MTLTRQSIRADAVARIKAANTLAGQRVYDSRVVPYEYDAELGPAVIVWAPRERNSWRGDTEPTYLTTTTLNVKPVIYLDAAEDGIEVDDAALAAQLDQLVDQVEAALMGSFAWRRQFTRVQNYDVDEFQGKDGKRPFKAALMLHDLEYYTEFTTEVADDFRRIRAEVDVAPPDGVPEVVIDETLPTT